MYKRVAKNPKNYEKESLFNLFNQIVNLNKLRMQLPMLLTEIQLHK